MHPSERVQSDSGAPTRSENVQLATLDAATMIVPAANPA